jgi:hypothetical protein
MKKLIMQLFAVCILGAQIQAAFVEAEVLLF